MTQSVADITGPQNMSTDAQLSRAVVEAVADAENADPTELPPLFAAIDPDALDALFKPASEQTVVTGTVQFRYAGYDVTVHEDGSVMLKDN